MEGLRFFPLNLLVGMLVFFIFSSSTAYSELPKVAAGAGHTVLLSQEGSVWSWGSNTYGQLGDGTNINRLTPVRLFGLGTVKDIACGERHTIVLMNDGSLHAWGGNNYGQLGNKTRTDSNAHVKVLGLTNVIAVAAGWWHTVALKNDGSVWTWGKNAEGQLGNGTTIGSTSPVQVFGLANVVAIAAGWGHSIALKSDSTVCAWGNNRSGQLANGRRNAEFHPVQVKGLNPDSYLSGIKSIACGGWHSMAIGNDGSLWAWGGNSNGQLGDGGLRSRERDIPVQVKGMDGIGYLYDVMAVSGGWMHTLVLKKSEGSNNQRSKIWQKIHGIVLDWGGNDSGQIGNGTYNKTSLPVQVNVKKVREGYPLHLGGVVSIAGGFYHSVAVRKDGSIWSWGDNSCGQIGDGTTTTRPNATKTKLQLRIK